MTQAEALQEARRRWGRGGWVRRHVRFVQVSNLGGCNREIVQGTGDSFEAAFADADRKEAEK